MLRQRNIAAWRRGWRARSRRVAVQVLAGSVALVGVLLGRAAHPQPARLTLPPVSAMGRIDAEARLDQLLPPRPSWRARLGAERARRLLADPDWRQRLRGIDRLAAARSPSAVEALVAAMASGHAVRANARTRLAAVRALAPHADERPVRRLLAAIMRAIEPGAPELPEDALVRATAALALARAGRRDTLIPLVTAVIRGGRSGQLARQALLAYPPATLEPLLGNYHKGMDPDLAELLGELGDPRAIAPLRAQLGRGRPPDLRASALVALGRLGDGRALSVARRVLAARKQRAALRVAAATALIWLDAPDAAAAVARLLGDANTRARALGLAALLLSPALVPTLAAVVAAPVGLTQQRRAVELLGQIGDRRAVTVLRDLLAEPELATAAAFGLARVPVAEGSRTLALALRSAAPGPARRLVMRAALLRQLQRGQAVDGLPAALAEAWRSRDRSDRAVAAFGWASLGKRPVAELARSAEPWVRHAVVRAALFSGQPALAKLGPLLVAAAGEGCQRCADFGAALLLPVPELGAERLARWAAGGGLLAPLASYRLAARDVRALRPRLEQLLGGTDPTIRLHVALGLGRSPERDAVSMLAWAYRFEIDAAVRRAIVRGLSLRDEAQRLAVLRLARDLDPDAQVRAMAASALGGRRLAPLPLPAGRQAAWVMLRANHRDATPRVAGRGAWLRRSDGLVMPVHAAPDGVLLVVGLSAVGQATVQLALAADSGDASTDGASHQAQAHRRPPAGRATDRDQLRGRDREAERHRSPARRR